MNNGEPTLKTGGTIHGGDDRKEIHKGLMKGSEMGIPLSRGLQDPNMLDPSKRTMRGGFGAVDFAKLKSKTVQEAARAAALAVAEAEAAAASTAAAVASAAFPDFTFARVRFSNLSPRRLDFAATGPFLLGEAPISF